MLPPKLYQRLFDAARARRPVATQRDLLDLHFTTYFNAGSTTRTSMASPSAGSSASAGGCGAPRTCSRFFRDYPDGRHITIVRDPKGNLASRLKYRTREDTDDAVDGERAAGARAAELQLAAKRRLWRPRVPDHVRAPRHRHRGHHAGARRSGSASASSRCSPSRRSTACRSARARTSGWSATACSPSHWSTGERSCPRSRRQSSIA